MIEKLFSLDAVYLLTGIVLFIFAAMTFADQTNPRRIGSGLFWLVLGLPSLLPSPEIPKATRGELPFLLWARAVTEGMGLEALNTT